MDNKAIRKKAEALLQDDLSEMDLLTDEDLPKILHELRVHQVELELQNEELRRIQEELQATQRKYFDLFNLAPVSYFSFDGQGKIIELNLTATQLLQRERRYLVGKPILSQLAPESHSTFFEHLDSVFQTGSRQQCELKIRRLETIDRPDKFVRLDSIAVQEKDTWICRSTMTDISQQKNLESEMLKSQKLEAVGLLAGGIAHDFNNLLTGLFGGIELAQMFLEPEHKSHKFLENAMRSMESATNLTKQLLTFAKGGEPVKETLHIGDLINEIAQFSLRGSSVTLQNQLASDLWVVKADKGQISQVISNLVINAQQAMPTGGVITLTGENVTISESRFVKITIEDNGVGIPPQYLDKIFDPYFSTKQKGSGLGLSITHSIINKHNGRITVDSEVGQGTMFILYLPATTVTSLKPIEASSRNKEGKAFYSGRILVLDDDQAVRETIGVMLEELGFEISFAEEGQEAVTKYKAAKENGGHFHAAILDLTIPGGMGGQMAAQEILSLDPNACLIVSSGYATDPVIANYEKYGFKSRVAKPYRFEELGSVIQKVLNL